MKYLFFCFLLPVLLFSSTVNAQAPAFWGLSIGTDSREVLLQKMNIKGAVAETDSFPDRLRFSASFEDTPANLVFDIAKASSFKSLGPDLLYAGYAAFNAKDWNTATTAAFMYKRYKSEKGPENRNCDNYKADFTVDSFVKEIGRGEALYLAWKEPGGFVRELQYLPKTQMITLGYHYVELDAIINLFKDAPQVHPPLIFNR